VTNLIGRSRLIRIASSQTYCPQPGQERERQKRPTWSGCQEEEDVPRRCTHQWDQYDTAHRGP